MKKTFKRFYLIPLILFTGILLLSSSAFAVYPYLPYLDYTANFNYCDGINKGADWCKASGAPANSYPFRWRLTFSSWNITGGNYVDGSQFGELSGDPITGAWFNIGYLYNNDYSNNLTFDNTQPPVESTGPVSFTITDGSNTYLSAQLNNFIITDGSFGTQLNPLFDYNKADLTNITFTPNGSQYIEELETSYLGHGYLNLSMDFTFYNGTSGGGYAFYNDANGSIEGKMAVTPEPVSSILFITGGATLAVRRFLKKKK